VFVVDAIKVAEELFGAAKKGTKETKGTKEKIVKSTTKKSK